jgi:hypothetical protein
MIVRIMVSALVFLSVSSSPAYSDPSQTVFKLRNGIEAYVRVNNMDGDSYELRRLPKGLEVHVVDTMNSRDNVYSMFEFTDDTGHVQEAWVSKNMSPDGQLIQSAMPNEDLNMTLVKIAPGKTWNPRCQNFIDDDGLYGDWGQEIADNLKPEDFPNFFDSTNVKDVVKLCPAFADFTEEQTTNFWVYTFAAVSMAESSCNRKALADGPNGQAGGLLQLHVGSTKLYCGMSIKTFVANDNLKCGMKILDKQLNAYNELFVSHGKTYWQTLQDGTGGAQVRKILKKYAPCFTKTEI